MAARDETGWLGSKDSKSQMSSLNTHFEITDEFRAFSEHLGTRDFSRMSCKIVADP
jgi:hypothetical protein